MNIKTWALRSGVVAAVGVAGLFFWHQHNGNGTLEHIASGNGRIEAVEIDIAARQPGRIEAIEAREGELVRTGQVLARMDIESLQAQLRQAEARMRQAEDAVGSARSQLAQRGSEKAAMQALVVQRQTELAAAERRARRFEDLRNQSFISQQQLDDQTETVERAAAALAAARAQVAAGDAAIAAARSQIRGSESAVEAARAEIARIRTDIEDSVLKAPRDGRVQMIVARPGEVVGAGGRVLNLVDLKDVYMTFFLPTRAVGRVAVGSEARLVLDAVPQYVIPARISFVADVAQFTPKTVETQVEREKLMFRVRAQIPPDLLEKHLAQVKTGLPGVAYVKLDPDAPWPAQLQARLPE
ncbi:MAG TPA: efflux RND transporter periplasmic adaptor subunit [Ottowia sp.]|uniref:HlyD family secretion protein n=1 Tax=Ottowia sp. TaxID=1898956 RepID=UPI002D038752|nr:HlyD family efflux transporter periplasmic adaptor subunit [Ottowia sp.]HMN21730.1 efflux RND transporter periplasmic adaptor subunit [Ottowia sp.]